MRQAACACRRLDPRAALHLLGRHLLGLRLRPVPYGRQVAHGVVGLAIGLRLTPAVLAATAGLLPAIAATLT